MPLETPIKDSGHIQILYGNLAPEVRAPCHPARTARAAREATHPGQGAPPAGSHLQQGL